jgi:hypothetical protein
MAKDALPNPHPGADNCSAFAAPADEVPRQNPTAKWGLTLTPGNIKLAISP